MNTGDGEGVIVLDKICRSLAIDPNRIPKPPQDAA
jgi:hypothetical protein